MKRLALIAHFVSLFFGTAIYLCFRVDTLKIFSLFDFFGFDCERSAVRVSLLSFSDALPDWVLFSLPDGLWVFSFACLMLHLWEFRMDRSAFFWMVSLPIAGVLSELAQAAGLLTGTYDFTDILFYASGFFLPIILFIQSIKFKSP